MPISWPDALKPRSVNFAPLSRTTGGGASLWGNEQIVASDAGVWGATMQIPMRGDETILAWRALTAGMGGRLNDVLVPVGEAIRLPWPLDEYGRVITPDRVRVRRLDGTPYADGANIVANLVPATLNTGAGLRASSIVINLGLGTAPTGRPQPATRGTLRAGVYFSIGSRLHVITAITGTSGNNRTCSIWPPLRSAQSGGTIVNFHSPACLMRASSDSAAQLELDLARFGTGSLDFVETLEAIAP